MISRHHLAGRTFELSWHRRWDARARLARMYRVPPTWPAWPAVGAQLERGVRRHSAAALLEALVEVDDALSLREAKLLVHCVACAIPG